MRPTHSDVAQVHPQGESDLGSVFRFFLFTFAVTWVCWFAAFRILQRGTSAAPAVAVIGRVVSLVGVFMPSLMALALTAKERGRKGVLALLRRIIQWRVNVWWYVFAAGFIAAIKLTVALVHRVASGQWPQLGHEAWYILAAATVISTWAQAGEEVGWRGFALPRLSKRFGLGTAGVLLGVLWACWHLPLFFVPYADTYGQSFSVYLLDLVALSVVMAWLYWRTDGSLLLVMLFHAAYNNTKDIVPSAVAGTTSPLTLDVSRVAGFTLALLWICAAYFLLRMRGAKLERVGDEDKTTSGVAAASLS